jgi:hypothetical protein
MDWSLPISTLPNCRSMSRCSVRVRTMRLSVPTAMYGFEGLDDQMAAGDLELHGPAAVTRTAFSVRNATLRLGFGPTIADVRVQHREDSNENDGFGIGATAGRL